MASVESLAAPLMQTYSHTTDCLFTRVVFTSGCLTSFSSPCFPRNVFASAVPGPSVRLMHRMHHCQRKELLWLVERMSRARLASESLSLCSLGAPAFTATCHGVGPQKRPYARHHDYRDNVLQCLYDSLPLFRQKSTNSKVLAAATN